MLSTNYLLISQKKRFLRGQKWYNNHVLFKRELVRKMRIGDRIRSLREEKGWTQLELAQQLGINNSVLSRIEANKRPVEDVLVAAFADVFQVNADSLLGREPLGGRAFFGGAHSYTEEELRVAEAAVEAYRRMKGLDR